MDTVVLEYVMLAFLCWGGGREGPRGAHDPSDASFDCHVCASVCVCVSVRLRDHSV